MLASPALGEPSSAWSPTPATSLDFSFELIAIYLLAVLTAGNLHADQSRGTGVVRRAAGNRSTGARADLLQPRCPIGRTGGFRYAWPGAHPLVASAEIGFALLLLLFAPRSEIGFSRR